MGLPVSWDSGEKAQGRLELLSPTIWRRGWNSEGAMLAIDSKLLRVIKMKVDCKDLQKTLTIVRIETIEEQMRLI